MPLLPSALSSSPFDAARFYRAAAGALTPSSIGTHSAAKSEAPVPSDCGVGLVPTPPLQLSAPRLDLRARGNLGVFDAFCDRETIEFVSRQRAPRICHLGLHRAIILGVAGLLKDGEQRRTGLCRSAASRRGTHEKARVVQDGNVITRLVSLGHRFCITVAAEIAGETTARKYSRHRRRPAPPSIQAPRQGIGRHKVGGNRRGLRQVPVAYRAASTEPPALIELAADHDPGMVARIVSGHTAKKTIEGLRR